MSSPPHPTTIEPAVSLRLVARVWWPLAGSWILMALELPLVAAVVNRLPNPQVQLAAYGGIVFPVALIIESPIIMLLAASTALCRDRPSYLRARGFMYRAGALLTAIHVLIAFTPLYYVVAGRILGAPGEILEPARVGLMIMTPWTGSIAYRRFQQGVLISFGHSSLVGLGTVLRMTTNLTVLSVAYLLRAPGIVAATSAVASSVVAEAIFAGLCVRPVVRHQLPEGSDSSPLGWRRFLAFYLPLALTSMLHLLMEPLGAAAVSRMPDPLDSLAVWPTLSGIVFLAESLGIALQEVVVALLGEPGAGVILRRFAGLLGGANIGLLLFVAATPLADLWFGTVLALPSRLASLAGEALWLGLLLPGLAALQSWYQGRLVFARATRGVTEGMVVFLVTVCAVLSLGVARGSVTGIYVSLPAFTTGAILQVLWLRRRARCMESDWPN